MSKYGDLFLQGRSGAKYCFHTWSLSTRFRSLGAVFFVTRRGFVNDTYRRASHEVIYLGQAANMAEPLGSAALLDAFNKHGANCVGVRLTADADDRARILEDLIAVQRPLISH